MRRSLQQDRTMRWTKDRSARVVSGLRSTGRMHVPQVAPSIGRQMQLSNLGEIVGVVGSGYSHAQCLSLVETLRRRPTCGERARQAHERGVIEVSSLRGRGDDISPPAAHEHELNSHACVVCVGGVRILSSLSVAWRYQNAACRDHESHARVVLMTREGGRHSPRSSSCCARRHDRQQNNFLQ